MSSRRHVPHIPRRTRPLPPRRRALAGVAAIVALVATAGAIGSHHGGGGDMASSSSAAARPQAGAMSKAKAPMAFDASASASGTVAEADSSGGAATSGGDAASTGTEQSTSSKSTSGAGSTSRTGTDSVEPKIIRTGSVELRVKKGTFGDALGDLTSIATGVGGFISQSETSQLGDDPQGTITLRVPSKDFDRVLASVAKLGTVSSASTSSQDVTGEYTDVAAHIDALEHERDQITLVLSKAETIPDILAVRDRLSTVQSELEQLQGRQQVLDDQTSLATLTVDLSEKGHHTVIVTKPEPDRRGLAKIWHDSADRFGDGASSIALGFAAMAPWLILALVLWLPGRILWRRLAPVEEREPEPAPVSAP